MKIHELIPATDWHAIYKTDAGYDTEPLVAWAIREGDDGSDEVVGIVPNSEDPGTEIEEDEENFIRYVHSSILETYVSNLKRHDAENFSK